ncbi:MAG: hypothetical protein IJY57_04120 [Clostridia bacterium]|nr:hypothetical protein [Clostridia bacterium]
MIYDILSYAIIGVELAVICAFIVIWKKKGESSLGEKWLYLIPSAVILYLLYAMGVFYDAANGGEPLSIYAFVNIIKCCYEVFIACVSTQNSALMLASNAYSIAFLVAVILAFATFISLMISVVKFFLFRKGKIHSLLRKGCDIVIGYSNYADIYMSNYKNTLLILTEPPTPEFKKELRERGVIYTYAELESESFKKLFKKSVNCGKDFHFLSFEGDAETLKTIAVFKRTVTELNAQNFYLYVKFDYRNYISINESVLQDEKFTAYISCFNEHELMARKFVENYPITRFAPQEFFDHSHAVIKEGKKFNTFYLGFGDSLSAVHRASLMNDRLVSVKAGKVCPLEINYFAYDKVEHKDENKNVHFYESRFFKRLQGFDEKEYYELPEFSSSIEFVPFDLDHKDGDLHFKNKILESKDCFNAVLISYGSAVENIDYALKTVMFFRQNDIINYHIFVKIDAYQPEYKDFFDDKVTFFGATSFVVNHDVIVDETLTQKAKSVNASYQERKKAISKWTSLSAIKKTSNLYSGLNLRLKLNLLGYDLLSAEEGATFDKGIVDEVVGLLKKGEPDAEDYNSFLFGKKKEFYACNALAYQEKLRWNAFYIVNGYIPMKKTQVESINGKIVKDDDGKKLHACLTSVWGLDEYHRAVAKIIQKEENITLKQALVKANTYIYDYSVIDVVRNLNEGSKYFIVRK